MDKILHIGQFTEKEVQITLKHIKKMFNLIYNYKSKT